MTETMRSRAAKGGRARAAKLTAEERRQIGIAGSLARWGRTLPEARYGSDDRPLRLGATEIGCYVLDDGRRVLGQGEFITALGGTAGTTGRRAGQRFGELFVGITGGTETGEIERSLENPLLFRVHGTTAYGYEASLLGSVCGALLSVPGSRRLRVRQAKVIELCEAMSALLSATDVNEMVDVAVGLESARVRERLVGPLRDLVNAELRAWVGSFPSAFFEELYRLVGLDLSPPAEAMPVFLGALTNDIVYDRLGPGVREEMARLAPLAEASGVTGETQVTGEPPVSVRLREHLASVVALMKISGGYEEFAGYLDTALPRWNEPG